MGQCCSSPSAKYVEGSVHQPKKERVEEPPPTFGVDDYYDVKTLLGTGGTGQTWLCTEKGTARKVAIKFIPRPLAKVLLPMVSSEIQIQARVGEGCISLVQLEHAVLSPSHLGLVMEYASGGNLTAYIMRRHSTRESRGGLYLSESEARYMFKQFISAVEYLHSFHVAHRDIKLDNIVLDSGEPPIIKICDFGFARDWEGDDNMLTSIGTPVYMSPQQLRSKSERKPYSASANDIWASGVLLFVMLLGMFPYDHESHPDPNSSAAHVEVFLEQQQYSWRQTPRVASHAAKLSESCRDLLDKMLCVNESERISISGIKAHPWYSEPLTERLQSALDEIYNKQSLLHSWVEEGEAKMRRRDEAVDKFVTKAGVPHHQQGSEPAYQYMSLAAVAKRSKSGFSLQALHSFDMSPRGGLSQPGLLNFPGMSPGSANTPESSVHSAAAGLTGSSSGMQPGPPATPTGRSSHAGNPLPPASPRHPISPLGMPQKQGRAGDAASAVGGSGAAVGDGVSAGAGAALVVAKAIADGPGKQATAEGGSASGNCAAAAEDDKA